MCDLISKDDLVFALTMANPPIPVDEDDIDFIANNLLNFCVIEKNLDDPIWHPVVDPEPEPGPEIPTTPPPPPHDD